MSKKVYISSDKEKDIKEIIKLTGAEYVRTIKEADMVVFPDEDRDVHPAFYKGKEMRTLFHDIEKDVRIIRDFHEATSDWKPMLAFGSSAILISAVTGAQIIPYVSGHTVQHELKTHYSRSMISIGSHAQLMNPYVLPEEDYILLAYSAQNGGTFMKFSDEQKVKIMDFPEPEIVYYKFRGSLCIQSPVYRMGGTQPYYLATKNLIRHLFNTYGYKEYEKMDVNPYKKKDK